MYDVVKIKIKNGFLMFKFDVARVRGKVKASVTDSEFVFPVFTYLCLHLDGCEIDWVVSCLNYGNQYPHALSRLDG